MELDDLKSAWKAEIKIDAESEERIVRQIIHRSNKGISRMIVWEAAIGAFVLLLAISMILFSGGKDSVFFFKLTVPILVFAIPIYYRLYRSTQFLKNMDFGKDMRTALSSFLKYYKRTLRLYEWGSYGALAFVVILFLTDAKFMSMKLWIQVLAVGFTVLSMFAIRPFVRRFYGRKVKKIESFLEESAD